MSPEITQATEIATHNVSADVAMHKHSLDFDSGVGIVGLESTPTNEAMRVSTGNVAVGGLLAAYKMAQNWLKGKHERRARDYASLTSEYARGPQLEGLSPAEYELAIQDERTDFIEVGHPFKNKKVKVPFLVPLEYAGWINPDFMTKKGYDPNAMKYCALPQALLAELSPAELTGDLEKATKKGAVNVVVDYPEYEGNVLARIPIITAHDELLTEASTPAAIYHYRTSYSANPEVVASYPVEPHIRQLSQEDIEDGSERIWEIYSQQFKGLVDDHPILGALPKEVLLESLRSPHCRTTVSFNSKSEIQAFGYIVDDLSLCEWLNTDYLTKDSNGLPVLYMPGIATAKDAESPQSTKIMNQLLKDSCQKFGDFVLTFECSNLSARYIPKLVKRAVDQSGLATITPITEIRHQYDVVTVG